jgi:hypothetical protein
LTVPESAVNALTGRRNLPFAVRQPCAHDRWVRAELRAELLHRKDRDQAARAGGDPDPHAMASVDADNVAWLQSVVAAVGWPGSSLVGEDGAHAAWLLAQHADADPAFQRRCLDLMTQAVDRGEATGTDLAYLTDRVLLAEGQPQEYGTQMTGREERWVPRRLRDPDHVDERRAAVSLGPMHEYIARMAVTHGPPKPTALTCHECGRDIEFWLPDDGETRQQLTCAACGWTVTVSFGAT